MFRFPPIRCVLLVGLFVLASTAQAANTILVLGDSLSAGFGIRQEAAWPTLLEQRLRERQFDYNVVNASISGETTSGGRNRIEAVLAKYSPRVVVIALGANDGLRGLPLATIRSNLMAIVESAQRKKARVLLVGQRLPPNYGLYAVQFHNIYGEIAQARKTSLVDFLLEGIAEHPQFFQPDNLHPTAEAQPLLLRNVWRGLEPLVK